MRLILFLLSFVIHADLSNNIDVHKEKYEKLALETAILTMLISFYIGILMIIIEYFLAAQMAISQQNSNSKVSHLTLQVLLKMDDQPWMV